jgi:SAM-dependent methyltransferase
MPESHPSPAWPSAPVLILCFLAPPLGLLAWVLGSAAQRATYLRSWWVRTGLTLLVLGSAPQPLRSCRVGDARALEIPGDSADVVLLLGPLYHLTDPGDRARSLHEAARVLKPGGWLFAAAISRWASALDGLARDLLPDPRFAAIVEQDLRDGQHRNPTDRMDYFTTAYFHRPTELADEVEAAGLALTGVYGVEGPGWILPDVPARMADVHRRVALLDVARMLETEPAVLGTSAHLLAVARRPT